MANTAFSPTNSVTVTTADKFIPDIWSDEIVAAYKAFEDEHLPRLREAALESVEALQKAFGAIPASPMKAKLWATHGQSLKNANKN